MSEPSEAVGPEPDWEAFYRGYRTPGYVPGYEITTKLGSGMFGLVFKARKQSIGKDYAIKFLKVDDVEVRRAILLELESVRLFAQIDHPNLVSIEDRGVADGIPYIVMAYAGDETLRDRLTARDRDLRELQLLFLQACRGVQALHDHSLVHFDLKPANVFLKGGVARVGDYGLSKLVAHSRNTLSMGRGTPYYMAPELLQNRGDARSDVYSLGVVLYECLTGDVPFRGDSEWEVLRQHEVAEPRYPAGVTAEQRAVLARALAKDPAARFPTVAELIAALLPAAAAARGGTPAPAPPPPPAEARRDADRADPVERTGLDLRSLWQDARRTARERRVARRVARHERRVLRRGKRRPRHARRGVLLFLVCIAFLFTLLRDGREDRRNRQRRATAVAFSEQAMPERTWLDAARVGDPSAGELLQRRLAEFRVRAVPGVAVPKYQVKLEVPADTLAAAREIADEVACGGAHDELRRYGYAGVVAAVEALAQQDVTEKDELQRATRLHRYLQSELGFDGIGMDTKASSRSKRNRYAAQLWRWFVHDFAGDAEAYDLYRGTLR
jgi:tRNA A-37 threonylcarbamoyl transferase component Bud32